MVAAALAYSAMHALVRGLSAELPPVVIAFWRNALGLAVMAPLLVRYRPQALGRRARGATALLSLLQACSTALYFYALAHIPLAQATTIGFTTPLFAAAGAVLLLGERVRLRRALALVVGMVGTLVVTRPAGDLHPGVWAALLSSLLWAAALMLIKVLSRGQSSVALAGVTLVLVAPLSALMALPAWRWPGATHWLPLVLAAALASAGQVATNEALRVAETTAVLPFDFTRLVWASLFAAVWFAETPSVPTWIGGALIFGSSFYIAYREAQIERHPRVGPTVSN